MRRYQIAPAAARLTSQYLTLCPYRRWQRAVRDELHRAGRSGWGTIGHGSIIPELTFDYKSFGALQRAQAPEAKAAEAKRFIPGVNALGFRA
jgi:hypothetical protein